MGRHLGNYRVDSSRRLAACLARTAFLCLSPAAGIAADLPLPRPTQVALAVQSAFVGGPGGATHPDSDVPALRLSDSLPSGPRAQISLGPSPSPEQLLELQSSRSLGLPDAARAVLVPAAVAAEAAGSDLTEPFLRLSQVLPSGPRPRLAGGRSRLAGFSLALQPSRSLMRLPATVDSPEGAAGGGEPYLRLSQALLPVPRAPAMPGQSILTEWPLRLQSSRGLAMPGAAGQGRLRGNPMGEGNPGDGDLPVPGDTLPASGLRAPEPPARPVGDDNDGDDADDGVSWVIPPIRWGGALGYSTQKSWSSNSTSLSQSIYSRIAGSSYIYAPWLATVSGSLGISTSSASSSSGGPSGDIESSRSGGSAISGSAEVGLLSRSRFPLQASFVRSNSRATGDYVSSDYTNTRFGLRQSYRPEDGSANGSWRFDHSTVQSSIGAEDKVSAMGADYNFRSGAVQNSFGTSYSLGERSNTGEQARVFSLNTAHSTSLEDNIGLSGNFGFADNSLRSGGAGGGSNSRARLLNLNAAGSWSPEFEDTDDLPLSLTGSARYAVFSNEFGDARSETQNMGANLAAYYRYSNNLSGGANAGVSYVTTNGSAPVLLTMAGGNVGYAGDPLMFGNFSYNWNAGSGVGWQDGSGEIPSSYFLSAQAGHSLGRFIGLSEGSSLSLNLSQSLSANRSQSFGVGTSLSHSAGAGYSMRLGEQFSGNVTANLSDNISQGLTDQHYRQLSVSFGGNGQLSPVSSADVNLHLNWSDQTVRDFNGLPDSTGNQRMTLNGSASYSHVRFFGVRGLRYGLIFAADSLLRDERLLGNVDASIDRTRWTVTNRWDYRIGLLDLRLNAVVNDAGGGKKNALLFFQVTRQIGAY